MAKPGLDVRKRSTAGNQPRDMGVPQIVKPERCHVFRRHRDHQLPPHVGVEVAVVQRQAQARLGHESITTTIDTYGHLLPVGDELISRIIDTALTGGTIRPVSTP